jgi:hypothetical protein
MKVMKGGKREGRKEGNQGRKGRKDGRIGRKRDVKEGGKEGY